MDKAQKQLHPPFDDRYQKSMKEKYLCEEAIKEVIQSEDPNERERLLRAWCVSPNKILSEAIKQVLEAQKPEEMKQQRTKQDKDKNRESTNTELGVKDQKHAKLAEIIEKEYFRELIDTIRKEVSDIKMNDKNDINARIEAERVQKCLQSILPDRSNSKQRRTDLFEERSKAPNDPEEAFLKISESLRTIKQKIPARLRVQGIWKELEGNLE